MEGSVMLYYSSAAINTDMNEWSNYIRLSLNYMYHISSSPPHQFMWSQPIFIRSSTHNHELHMQAHTLSPP
jgi:hypothetical protein